MATVQKQHHYGSVALLIVGSILLFFAQSAYWINHTIFNQENFTRITTTALMEESSRNAVASAIVDKALADRPVAQRAIGQRATSLISGLLGSDLSSQAIETISDKTYAYATASNRQDIKIDLSGIKTPLGKIVEVSDNPEGKLAQIDEKLPDEIILVESDAFPDLSGAVRTMLYVGPLLWLGALGAFGWYIYLGRSRYAKSVYAVGLAIATVAVLGLLGQPFIPPPIAAAVQNITLRPVAENIATGFLAPFAEQMYFMLGFSLIALLIFNQRFNLLGLVRSLESKLSVKPKAQTLAAKKPTSKQTKTSNKKKS